MGVKAIHYGLKEEHETVYECDRFDFSLAISCDMSGDEKRYYWITHTYRQWPRSVWPEHLEKEACELEKKLCLNHWKS